MHSFHRGREPIDFAKYKGWSWNSFSKTPDHAILGDALYGVQDGYCAYCETHLDSKDKGHIEHLERRSEHHEKTFDWNNLFFSCLSSNSCGKYKDEHGIRFSRADIVDPSREKLTDFFTFNMMGKILAKDGVGKHRAEETIRVFNLNDPGLVQKRQSAGITVSRYFDKTDTEKDEFLAFLAESRVSFLFFFSTLLNRN